MQVHQQPLLVLTRPQVASRRFATRFPGVEALIAPLIEIVGTGARPDLSEVGGVILTSANAVGFLPPGDGLPAYCVGLATAGAARSHGYDARAMGGDADALTEALLALRPAPPLPLFHAHGAHVRGDISGRLTAAGLTCQSATLYRQNACSADPRLGPALQSGRALVPVFSPRSAQLLASAARQPPAQGSRLFALSPAIRDALPASWHPLVEVSPEPTADALAHLISRHLANSEQTRTPPNSP